jgi:hypothetical protein
LEKWDVFVKDAIDHLLMQMYNSTGYALTQSHKQLKTHDWTFKELLKTIKEHCKEGAVHRFALK